MSPKRLTLRAETLTELTTDELAAVAGAAASLGCPQPTTTATPTRNIGCLLTFNSCLTGNYTI